MWILVALVILVVVVVGLYMRGDIFNSNIQKTEMKDGATLYRLSNKNKNIFGLTTAWNNNGVLLSLGIIGPNGEKIMEPIEEERIKSGLVTLIDTNVGGPIKDISFYQTNDLIHGVVVGTPNGKRSEVIGKAEGEIKVASVKGSVKAVSFLMKGGLTSTITVE
jgi:NADPH-dependent 2,4-dienoyl-CoA reductase/sulfur reductase-like enzyme